MDCGEYLPELVSKMIHVPVPMSAFGGKADIGQPSLNVRF
jgi:hypothetical protein